MATGRESVQTMARPRPDDQVGVSHRFSHTPVDKVISQRRHVAFAENTVININDYFFKENRVVYPLRCLYSDLITYHRLDFGACSKPKRLPISVAPSSSNSFVIFLDWLLWQTLSAIHT